MSSFFELFSNRKRLILSVFPVLLLSACSLQMKEKLGPPTHPLSGLWMEARAFKADYKGPWNILHIQPGVEADIPYVFHWVNLLEKDMALSGKRLFTIHRSGKGFSSSRELLLKQTKFLSVYRDNKSKVDTKIWPMNNFHPEVIERSVSSEYKLTILKLSPDGRTLKNGDIEFRRVLPAKFQQKVNKKGVGLYEVGLIIKVSRNENKALAYIFDSAAKTKGRVIPLIDSNGLPHKTKADKVAGDYAVFKNVKGKINVGSPVMIKGVVFLEYMGGKRSGKLSVAEIKHRLRKGQTVSREDMLRAINSK